MDTTTDILTESQVVVVMVPLPAQGHLNQLLNMSRLILARGVPIHFISSAIHNRQAKLRIHAWEPSTLSNIHFHDVHLPSFPTPSPEPNASTNFPAHYQPVFEATEKIQEPLAALLRSLSTRARRVIVVHDSLMCFAAKEACSISNGEAYSFHSVSALSTLFYKWEGLGKPTNGEVVLPDDLPHLSFEDCFTDRFTKFVQERYKNMKYVSGYLYNTCRVTEARFIDLLAQEKILGNKKQWAIGPLNPVSVHSEGGDSQGRHNSLNWLDRQPNNSVLYVSFGTLTSMSREQITELAIGLELSKQRFIWVLRDADKGDIFAQEKKSRKIELPHGYEERLKGVGLIVRDWAPQLQILAHPSTGGFVSHCGWNSCMESLSMGVPIAAWPMHSDQPRNTMLVTGVLKTGLVLRDWARRKELLSSSAIKSAVKKLMASEEGDGMRHRAQQLGVSVRKAVSKGGTSTRELDSFIKHILR
ncbi:cis-zeatin O-beta-D-glucosyltransferase [Ranunculus cassubicifolius]